MRIAAVLGTLVLALAAAGCGGDDSNDATQQWADDVCTNLNTWVTSLQSTIKGLTEQGLSVQQSDIQAAADEAKTSTDDLVNSLNALGPPDTEAGQKAKGELDDLGTELQQHVETVQQASASNSGTLQLAQTVASAASASAAAAKSTFESIKSIDTGELKSAVEDSDACKTLSDEIQSATS
jgi:CHASE3 domain sensor protein